ncbi:hypothetical protein Avbf_07947 [Armadillidium vulgare]|nr:hypothetical protein Avbf_07947 [Armadillidium vulgare]
MGNFGVQVCQFHRKRVQGYPHRGFITNTLLSFLRVQGYPYRGFIINTSLSSSRIRLSSSGIHH